MSSLVGIFDAQGAERALRALARNGFPQDSIKVLDGTRDYRGATPIEGNPALIAPIAAGQSGSAAVPINPLAAGAIGASMSNDFGNEFNGLGFTDEATRSYRDSLKNGATVLILQADADRIAEARRIFDEMQASQVSEQ